MRPPPAGHPRTVTPSLPDESPGPLRAAGRDPILWTGVALWFLSLLPSLAPVLSPDVTYDWAGQFNDVPILLWALVAMAIALHHAEERRERTFWWLLMGSPVTSLVARVLYVVIPWEGGGLLSDQTIDLAYLLGYLSAVLALEFRPRGSRAEPPRPRRVERLGMLLYAFFLLSYFTLAPSIFRPELYLTWVPSMLLFSVMDAYLLARTWWLLDHEVGPAWAGTFRWLRAAFLLWLVGDLTEGLMYMHVIPYTDPGTPPDILWMTPGLLLLVVARRRSWIPRRVRHGG